VQACFGLAVAIGCYCAFISFMEKNDHKKSGPLKSGLVPAFLISFLLSATKPAKSIIKERGKELVF